MKKHVRLSVKYFVRQKLVRTRYIYNLKEKKIPENIGVKARNLSFMVKKKFQIPETYVCTWDAHSHYLQNGEKLKAFIKDELIKKVDLEKNYAIRSSANIEDGEHYSCAGQFKSILDVHGIDNIIEAIETIWSSMYSEGVSTYLERVSVNPDDLKMAVIIQEMVDPIISGVSFSKNPMTGMDEIIVEAVHGEGEALMQNGLTPERWVSKWGEWIEEPNNVSIDPHVIARVVSKTKDIAHIYGNDVDVEWVYDGNTINWVQLREITSLKNTTLYSDHFAREVFPGIIKPLVWSINVPLVCGAWMRLFTELIGKNDINPRSLAKSFYYRAYFNMGTIGKIFEALGLPRNTIELLMAFESNGSEKPSFKPTKKTLTLLPNMLHCAFDKARFAKKIDAFLPDMKERYHSFDLEEVAHSNEHEIIAMIERLYALNEETAYYMIVTYILMGLYNVLLENQLKKRGGECEKCDLLKGMDELSEFDPNVNLLEMSQQFNQLDEITKNAIKRSSYQEFLALGEVDSFAKKVRRFIEHFGHLSDSGNDFSAVPWRENPDAILSMIVNYTRRKDKPSQKIDFRELPLSSMTRLLLTPLYKRTRAFRLYREAVGSLYTYGYGLFRTYFLSLGEHFVQRAFLTEREDIFYLYFDEIREIVRAGEMYQTYSARITQRKTEIKEYENITLPDTIYGDDHPPVTTSEGARMKGIPTSKGLYKGRIRVIRGVNDFQRLRDGDVLVIPYSDVGWTPLFTKAGAIIAEAGGFLSHSSIIAREYEIPAVVSVHGACQLKDGTLVTVDGYQGDITIHQNLLETQLTRGNH
jgi:pyruvate,water dikinase